MALLNWYQAIRSAVLTKVVRASLCCMKHLYEHMKLLHKQTTTPVTTENELLSSWKVSHIAPNTKKRAGQNNKVALGHIVAA